MNNEAHFGKEMNKKAIEIEKCLRNCNRKDLQNMVANYTPRKKKTGDQEGNITIEESTRATNKSCVFCGEKAKAGQCTKNVKNNTQTKAMLT